VAIDAGVVGRCPSWLVDLLHVHHGVSIVLGFRELVVRSTVSRRRLTNTITTKRHPERIYHIVRCNAVHDLYTRPSSSYQLNVLVFRTITIYLANPCRR